MSMLAEATIFLLAAVIVVPLFHKLNLGGILGYLAAGAAIGPSGLGLIAAVDDVLTFAKLGVVLLLFVIGLELAPKRLWTLRHSVFGLGALQVTLCALPIGAAAWWAGLAWPGVVVVALGLAFSSTAFAIQALSDRGELNAAHGRGAFAILLFKYIALLPLLAAIPLMAGDRALPGGADTLWVALQTVGLLAAVVVGGHYLLRPVFRIVASADTGETFTATALLVVLGTAVIVEMAGMPMAIGAFLAGVLLADSEYRHEIHARIEPFKGLLLGLFFIAVGMSADLALALTQPVIILGLTAGLIATKLAATYAAARITGMPPTASAKLTAFLPQGGELAFVLFAAAGDYGVLPAGATDTLIAVVTLSMAATPLVLVATDRLVLPRLQARAEPAPAPDGPAAITPEVVIVGFGRYGQLVGRLLNMAGVQFTAIDANPRQVAFVRRFGHRVSFGNASTPAVLANAGVGDARAVILAIDNVDESVKIAKSLRQHHPRVPVYALTRTRAHTWHLMDLGVNATVRSPLGPSLELGGRVLDDLGWDGERVQDLVGTFRDHDENLMLEQYAVQTERGELSQAAAQVAHELEDLFESDPDEPDAGRYRETAAR